MYKAIVFDLYGTILDIRTDEDNDLLWERMAHFYRVEGAHFSAKELKAKYNELINIKLIELKKAGVQHPDFDVIKVFMALYDIKGVKVSDRKLIETARVFRLLTLEYIKPYPNAVQLMAYIKNSSYRTILLTNAQNAFTVDELKATGIHDFFDGIYISSNFKVAKPDIAFFRTMLQIENLDAKDCLMVGNDHTTDIEGAASVGMDSVYIHTNCSRKEVPKDIPAKWRVESLLDVMRILKDEM